MSLTYWMPLREWALGRTDPMDGGPLAKSSLTVPVDVIERDHEIEVRATVPGYAPDELEITVQGDLLTLKGRHEESTERKEENYHLRERRVGSFQRTVQLPSGVVGDGSEAEYKNGELTLRLPKRPEAMTRRIAVVEAQKPA